MTPYDAFLTAQGQVFTAMKNDIGGQICYSAPDAVATCQGDVITVTIVNGSFDRTKQVFFPNNKKVWNGQLYTSNTVIPPSFFEIQNIRPDEIDSNGCYTMPAHSVMLVTLAL